MMNISCECEYAAHVRKQMWVCVASIAAAPRNREKQESLEIVYSTIKVSDKVSNFISVKIANFDLLLAFEWLTGWLAVCAHKLLWFVYAMMVRMFRTSELMLP